MKRLGYDLDKSAEKLAEIYGMDPIEIFSKGRQKQKVQARSLFCFWAVRELGIAQRELARKLDMTSPAIGYSVERGKAIAHDNGYDLINNIA